MSETTHEGEAGADRPARSVSRRRMLLAGTALAASGLSAGAAVAQAQPAPRPAAQSGERPNILVLWGDDVGVHNISAYNHGVMAL